MVLLTMTPSMVEAIQAHEQHQSLPPSEQPPRSTSSPPLVEPAVGKPISHSQVLDLWKTMADSGPPRSLEELLRGANIYVPPPPPKPEPTEEFKALMAKLRRDEEAKSYDRMVTGPRLDAPQFSDTTRAFAAVNRPAPEDDVTDEENAYKEVNEQVILILNFLASMFGVAVTIWFVARWWSTPARLFLTLGGALVVGIAEVIVYSGYMWRVEKAKEKLHAEKEVKEVVGTWVVESGSGNDGHPGAIEIEKIRSDEKPTGFERQETDSSLRRRPKGPS